jgi:glycine betaine/proline transport system substrate-binding protein
MRTNRAPLWAMLALVGSGLACTSSDDAAPATDGGADGATTKLAIKLAANPWDASRLNAEIARILLVDELGYDVAVNEIDEFKQFDALERGDLHASLEVWPSGHVDDITNYVNAGKVEDGGALGPLGKIGWYVPTYMLTTYPDIATKGWEALKDPKLVEALATTETNPKGRFLSGDKTWVQYDQQIIDNLGLNLQVVYAGSEDAEIAEIDRAYTRRAPILFYMWVPHSLHAKYDVTPVALKPYSEACYADPAKIDCDYPADRLFKVFWPQLKTRAPSAYTLLKRFSYTTKDQIALLGKVANDKQTVEQAARAWIRDNQAVWRNWIEK